MQRNLPPFRADHVGSILRTAPLKEARVKRASGQISAAELAAMVEEGRPAPAPVINERLDPLRSARVGGALQKLGYEPGPRVLRLTREDLGPIHLGALQLLGPHVVKFKAI